ncbi:MAG: sulfite exporter TauE/SafE family protein [Bacteroidota bacterium]
MHQDITILLLTAASIGFLHTLLGPDHYLPFIVMSRARKWSMFKTAWVTALCGLGHVGSSILLGSIGIAFGIGITKIEFWEGSRGNLAAWLFIAFGLVYFAWGLYRAFKDKPHTHAHIHSDRSFHTHNHDHIAGHAHIHKEENITNLTPWVLFLIFAFGPCEPLIPILMYPAAQSNIWGLILVTGTFAIITIATMLAVVLISSFGINLLPLGKLEKYTHAIAGAIIFLSGAGILFLGL